LYWSGSKAGWLIALVMVAVVLGLGSWPRRLKLMLMLGLLAAGLAGFVFKYSGYFAKGATSVGARMDYWRAAATTFRQHPLTGSGPGTFSATYRQLKPPEAEMTHLAHNDYLQQACDSGLIGLAAYAVFIGGMLITLRPARWEGGWRSAAWLGVLGWALQSGVEFGLYIPALAWPAFLLLGWLRATRPVREARA
jgi:O-antigen ligase